MQLNATEDADWQAHIANYTALDASADTRAFFNELVQQHAHDELRDRLTTRLAFGTAGLRGKMGVGYNHMNGITVQQTTQGLLRYVQSTAPHLLHNGIAIGFDGRHQSREFADIAARVCVSQRVRVHLFARVCATPLLAACVTHMRCAAGIMITASHNPKDYNGYKVYWSNGCQIIPPHDVGIAAAIEDNLELWQLCDDALHSDLVSDPTDDVEAWYFSRLQEFVGPQHSTACPLTTYTALHGVGYDAVRRAFDVVALPQPVAVVEQQLPDPDFPTVTFPNPEEGAGVWDLSLQTAERVGAQLMFANDPDADRFAVAERREDGSVHYFGGNDIGVLLAHWVWTQHTTRSPHDAASRVAMLASTVSSRMLAAMARTEGFHFEETLTGFKWLGNTAAALQERGYTVLFAFEEAIGYMMAPIIKDKDGISAAVVCASMAASLYARGATLCSHLAVLRSMYGSFEYRSGYFVAPQPHASAAVFERLRSQPPQTVGGCRVISIRDLGTGVDTEQPDGKCVLPWTAGDMMITYRIEPCGSWLTLRASGTEPKLKYYMEIVSDDEHAARQLAQHVQRAVADELVLPDRHGLKQPAHAGL